LAVISGGVYWARSDESDWWATYDDPDRGTVPKFKFHWPEQLVICGIVGSLAAVPMTAAAFVARLAWSRWTAP
jgi:hypothetical protein